MAQSMTITFGRSSSASLMAWRPSPASPATVISGSSSRMRRNPRRTREWSSTNRTEILSGMGIKLLASLWGLAIEPAFLFRSHLSRHPPARAAKIRPCPPATLRVPASQPGQFPALRLALRNPSRDLPPRLPKLVAKIAAAPRIHWLPNAGSRYSELPALRDTHEWRRCQLRERVRPISHRIRESQLAFPPPANTSRACSPTQFLRASPDAMPAKGCVLCPAYFARSHKLHGVRNAAPILPERDFRRASAWRLRQSGSVQTHRATRVRCGAT